MEIVAKLVVELEVCLVLWKEQFGFLEEFYKLKESWNENDILLDEDADDHDGDAESLISPF